MSVHGFSPLSWLAVLLALGLLAACGPDDVVEGPPADPPETPAVPDDPDDDVEADMELTGTFSGDADLEGGCAWVEDDGTRYEVLWPSDYEVAWDPLELRGPDGEVVARDGDELRVTGTVAEDMVSICMVGPILEAATVEPR